MINFDASVPQNINTTPVTAQPSINKKAVANESTIAKTSYKKVPVWAYRGVTFMGNNDVLVKIGALNTEQYKQMAQTAVEDVKHRAGQKGEFLNWIGVLPENQLKNLDSLYSMVEQAKGVNSTNLLDKATKSEFTDLAILGIGGSRHTTEAMMKMLGKDSKIHFYSGIDQESFNRFASTLDLNKTKFLVVSKSGGTRETTVAYESAKKLLQEKLGKTDVSDRFIAMTDASAEKSKLRQVVNKGDIKLSGQVHDDVGGRFSIFDDATIFTMAYAGIPKTETERMLKASLAAQKEFLNPDIKQNEALQLAAFNTEAISKGKTKHYVEYFGDAFEGATLWEKQMKNESLKSKVATDTNIGPAYLHYNAESDLDKNNKDSFYTFVYVKPNQSDLNTRAVLEGVVAAYSKLHPVSQIELKDLSPESIARLIELKHFETLYTGNMLRQKESNIYSLKLTETPKTEALPEVLQPNVEIYKKEVNAAFSKMQGEQK